MTVGAPLRRAQQLAIDAERAGFDGLVVTEAGRTAYLTCVAAAPSTWTFEILRPASRWPSHAAPWSPPNWPGSWPTPPAGSSSTGLGTQVRAHVERRYGSAFEHPGPAPA